MKKSVIRTGVTGAALAAFTVTLPALAPAAQNGRAQTKQSAQAQTKQSASPAASATIKNKATQDLGAKLLTKRRSEPSP
jgi:hypothetical protein